MTDIHPELRSIARFLPRGVASKRSLPIIRRMTGLVPSKDDELSSEQVVGEITVRLHRPPDLDGPAPALLWIHGGGMVLGSAAQDDELCRRFATELGIVVAAVDYRLAPEHPHPTPVEDCYAALRWLADRDDVDAERVAVGGASAGGGLAASLALLARDRGEVSPAFQLLVYPMIDDRTCTRTDIDERNFRLWNNKSNRFGWESYLGVAPGSDGVDPIAAPSRHPDLAGLPPAWIGVGDLDLFHDEDVAYADRLAAAGVPTELVIVEGAFHGFDAAAKSGVVRQWIDSQCEALRVGLGLTPG